MSHWPLATILDRIDGVHRAQRDDGYRDGMRAMSHAHDEAVRSGVQAAAIMLRTEMPDGITFLRPAEALEAAARMLEAKSNERAPPQPGPPKESMHA